MKRLKRHDYLGNLPIVTIFHQICQNSTIGDQFLPFLDYFKSQLIERFIKHKYIISSLQNLIPSFLIKLNPSSNEFKKCIDFYKSFLPTYETFESELKV